MSAIVAAMGVARSRANDAMVAGDWSTVAYDPRPCAWPRPFARGATP